MVFVKWAGSVSTFKPMELAAHARGVHLQAACATALQLELASIDAYYLAEGAAVACNKTIVPSVDGAWARVGIADPIAAEAWILVFGLPAAAGEISPQLCPPACLDPAPRVLRASLEPESSPPCLLRCPALLQALEVLPRLEQVRTPSCISPLCFVPVPRVRRHAHASPAERPRTAADALSPPSGHFGFKVDMSPWSCRSRACFTPSSSPLSRSCCRRWWCRSGRVVGRRCPRCVLREPPRPPC